MFNVFDWIRNGVREAFVAGIADGLAEIGEPPEGGEVAIEQLRARVKVIVSKEPDKTKRAK